MLTMYSAKHCFYCSGNQQFIRWFGTHGGVECSGWWPVQAAICAITRPVLYCFCSGGYVRYRRNGHSEMRKQIKEHWVVAFCREEQCNGRCYTEFDFKIVSAGWYAYWALAQVGFHVCWVVHLESYVDPIEDSVLVLTDVWTEHFVKHLFWQTCESSRIPIPRCAKISNLL